jgi:integrase
VKDNEIVTPQAKNFAEYILYLRENKKPATANLYLIVIRMFFQFLENQHIYTDLTKSVKIKFEKVDSMRRNDLKEQEAKILLACVRKEKGRKGARDRLIIETALYSGLRVSEIASLRKEDVIEDGVIYKLKPLRKGKSDRSPRTVVFICEELYLKLQRYVKRYKIENYVFTDVRYLEQKRLSGNTISEIINSYLRKCKIKRETVTPHSLRHFYLTQYYQKTKDIFLTQHQAGHTDINSTMVYMHPSFSKNVPVLEMSKD